MYLSHEKLLLCLLTVLANAETAADIQPVTRKKLGAPGVKVE
jgi:hypothetical protein